MKLRSKFILYILPLGVILPLLLYTLVTPYTQVRALFSHFEEDSEHVLAAEQLSSLFEHEQIEFFHLILSSGSSVEHEQALEESEENLKKTLSSLKESMLEEEEEHSEELDLLREIEKGHQELDELEQSALNLAREGKKDEAVKLLLTDIDEYIHQNLDPQIERLVAFEEAGVRKNIPILIGTINRFGVIPIPYFREKIEGLDKDFSHVLLSQHLAHLFEHQQTEFFHLVLDGEKEEHTAALEGSEEDITETINSLKNSFGEEGHQEEVALLQELEAAHIKLDLLGEQIIELSGKKSDQEKTESLLTKEMDQLLHEEIDPKVDQLVLGERKFIESKVKELREDVDLLVNFIYGASILVFIVGLFSIWSLSRTVVDRVISLRNAAVNITGGDLTSRAVVSSKDEIGELGQVFNNMVQKLLESKRDLEKKVEEQTQLLTTKVKDLEDTKKATLNLLEDIDEEKTKLAQANAKDEAILVNIAEGLVVFNLKGEFLLFNEQAKKILGKGPTDKSPEFWPEVYGMYSSKNDREMIDMKDFSLVRAMRGDIVIGDEILIKNDAKPEGVYIKINAGPIKINNQVTAVVFTFTDITHEKEVDRMKTEFISLASHQLRTPLSAMKWFSEMLLAGDAGKLADEQKEYIQNIYDSNDRMIKLVNGLLNISRIESGRLIIEPKPTDLKEIVSTVLTELKQKIEEKKIKLIVSIHETLPKINVDSKLIEQVYLNLLTNSIKYTPMGGEITVIVSKKDQVIISQVSDTGLGIPQKDQSKIFSKFFRAENVVKVEADGSGLGLYLVKSIVESSGGKIWFESQEGKGTSFYFDLPLSGSKPQKGEVALDS